MLNHITHRTIATSVAMVVVATGLVGLSISAAADSPNAAPATPGFPALDRAASPADRPTPQQRVLLGTGFAASAESRTARAFDSPSGKGWAYATGGHLCVAIPDPASGYGQACTPMTQASEFGTVALMIDPRRPSVSTVAAVLPDDASARVHLRGGRVVDLPLSDGISVARLSDAAKVEVSSAGGHTRQLVVPDLKAIRLTVRDCRGDVRTVDPAVGLSDCAR